ncbi:MAG: lysophospholipase [Myxococcota bacterium]|nr:lysophospholipase [Myxococcota bacterium]
MKHDQGFFSGKGNLRLYWETTFPEGEPKGHVILVHGYQDHVGRSKGPLAALNAAGFATHAYDFRGHGKSDGRRGHCQHFSEFVDDLDLFVQRVKKNAGGRKVFLLTHSHGGLTAVHWLHRTGGAGIAGAIFSAPYLKLAFTPPRLKVLGARLAGRVVPWLPIKSELTSEVLSRDVEVQKAADTDPLYNRTVTPRWFTEANRAQQQAMTYGPSIEVPSFVFYGSDDQVAAGSAARQLFESLASRDKKLKEYPGMRHECMNEIGKEEVFSDLVGWISSHL